MYWEFSSWSPHTPKLAVQHVILCCECDSAVTRLPPYACALSHPIRCAVPVAWKMLFSHPSPLVCIGAGKGAPYVWGWSCGGGV